MREGKRKGVRKYADIPVGGNAQLGTSEVGGLPDIPTGAGHSPAFLAHQQL